MSELDDWATSARQQYFALLDDWNRQNAVGMAARFTERGSLIGFDGSAIDGRTCIEAHLAPIFAQHPTPLFVAKVREVRRLAAGQTLLLRAVAGMWPRNAAALDDRLNAMQTLVLSLCDGTYRIEMFQNTPAAFHGRPEEAEKLTAELRALGKPEGA
ncbi:MULTISPECIES: SgcJ/EcaC family oxidoreductase [unclassified Caballeronia]|uniref:SgcJ/EcaC family oxidoreductase n=1 Tax=unclassified Caballeronia TaxID=2646786 RepID=UPI0028544BD3|nr:MULTISPECIES: SgcJ/EcaC family oxidoreductase [unclassified Caballeronia]MDR5737026.1 SgcJ/EcaC family oxidoreductase [Caballeronia sp. LZ016]MDR5810444.1 SgcJ/EcaC family oxidoreductase [Caballeronia sp. LZ019]